MISAALTGRPKPAQKWLFNELDLEPVATHFQYGPFKDYAPNPLKQANLQRSPGRGRNILSTGILSIRSIGALTSRLHVIDTGCKRLSSGDHGVQWLAVIVTASSQTRAASAHKFISWQLFLGRHASHVMR